METRVVRRTLGTTVALAAAALLLTACAPVGNAAVTSYAGWPEVTMPGEGGSGTMPDGTPHAMWIGDGGKLAVITYGSGNCPVLGTTIDVVKPAGAGNTVRVNTEDYSGANLACTRDLVAHTTEFWTPQNIATTEPLTVEVGDATIEVPIKGSAFTGGEPTESSH